MKVFNEANISKLARLNAVLRRLREAGVKVVEIDCACSNGWLLLDRAPPTEAVPPLIHKIKGFNVVRLNGVTLAWEGAP